MSNATSCLVSALASAQAGLPSKRPAGEWRHRSEKCGLPKVSFFGRPARKNHAAYGLAKRGRERVEGRKSRAALFDLRRAAGMGNHQHIEIAR
jgi:hypothetical protein